MRKYKICVYAITKNEEQFAERWMNSMREADEVIVTDTGSTDSTAAKLCELGAAVFEEKVVPWRFDVARNLSLGHVPEDADICVCTDLDETLNPGWREKLEQAWQPGTKLARYLYNWSLKPDGSPDLQFVYEKVHARLGYRWVHPVHEVLEYSGSEPQTAVFADGMVLSHRPDPNKSRGQYLPLLELSAKENPEDNSVALWLGREYLGYQEYAKCISALKTYLALKSSVWDEERSAAMRFLAKAYDAEGNSAEARSWLLRAVAECPNVREPYLQLALFGYLEEDWPLAFWAAEKGLAIPSSSGSYLAEPEAWGSALWDLGAIACYWLGLYEKALGWAETACEKSPGDVRLLSNLDLIREKLGKSGPSEAGGSGDGQV